jgi:RNA polymerase sigma-70 factor, ECF subfamily
MSASPQRKAARPANANGRGVYGVVGTKRPHLHPPSRTLSIARGSGHPRRPLDGSAAPAAPGDQGGERLGTPAAVVAESDAQLIARVRGGDVAAFSGLVQRHLRTAFGIAYHVLQHREDAEDAVQQAFIAALARLDTFDATRPFGPWISRVALNHARSARRARTRLVHGSGEPIETIETSPAAGPDRAAERSEIRQRVRDAIARLPERQRLAVQLIDIEGYAPTDIAAMLDLSPVTIRWHLMAARRKLRRLLAPLAEGIQPPDDRSTSGGKRKAAHARQDERGDIK